MSVIQWAEDRTRSMTLLDVGMLKIYCVLFGVIIGAYVPALVTENVWWIAAVVLLLGARGAYRWLTAPGAPTGPQP